MPVIRTIFLLLLCVSPARGQSPPAEPVPPKPQAATPSNDQNEDDWGLHWDSHPTLHLGRDTWIEFHARFGWNVRWSDLPLEDQAPAVLDLVRRRIGIEGRLFRVLDVQVERELRSDNPWRDVYANYRQFDRLRVQAGKFKLPFSLDENTSSTNLDFIYRSLAANQLAPGRDRGVMAHGAWLDNLLTYEAGFFDHDGRNARTRNVERVFGGRTAAGRLTTQPFRSSKSAASDFQAGVALTRSDVPLGMSSLGGRTALDTSFYSSNQWVQGQRQRIGLEGRWRPGPFSVKSEYIRVTTERLGQSTEDTDLSPLLATGWYVSGSWALTGENKARGLDNPRRAVHRGGPGAIEVALRVEQLAFGSRADGDTPSTSPRADVVAGARDRAVTLGVNWHLNRWLKCQFNAIRETIADARQAAPASMFWSRIFRLQFII